MDSTPPSDQAKIDLASALATRLHGLNLDRSVTRKRKWAVKCQICYEHSGQKIIFDELRKFHYTDHAELSVEEMTEVIKLAETQYKTLALAAL